MGARMSQSGRARVGVRGVWVPACPKVGLRATKCAWSWGPAKVEGACSACSRGHSTQHQSGTAWACGL